MSKTTSNFKQNLEELEAIVEWFESSDIDIDQALEKFERGLKLAAELKDSLTKIENRVTQIKHEHELGSEQTE